MARGRGRSLAANKRKRKTYPAGMKAVVHTPFYVDVNQTLSYGRKIGLKPNTAHVTHMKPELNGHYVEPGVLAGFGIFMKKEDSETHFYYFDYDEPVKIENEDAKKMISGSIKAIQEAIDHGLAQADAEHREKVLNEVRQTLARGLKSHGVDLTQVEGVAH